MSSVESVTSVAGAIAVLVEALPCLIQSLEMPKERTQNPSPAGAIHNGEIGSSKSFPEIPPEGLLSFLKETRGVQTWTEKDLAKALKIGLAYAKEAAAVLQLQGYIEPAGRTGKWRITEQGDLVSGAKAPRFTRQSVEEALDALRNRIKAVNEDRNAAYKITQAVAFGDFLNDAARVQAPDVGIRLLPRTDSGTLASAKEHAAQLAFLKQLRGKTTLLHIQPYEDWMGSRSHQDLL